MSESSEPLSGITDDPELQIRLFKQAVEQTAHAVYITDTDGHIEYVNPAFETITGYSAEEVQGRNPSLLQADEHSEEWYENLWETILNGDQWQEEMIDETKDGERIVLEQTISPITGEDGEIKKFVAVAQDITIRKKQQARLEEQRDDLELLNQVLRHDIRNHLQLVSAYADMLDEYLDEEGHEYLTKVKEGAENAVALTTVAKDMAEVMLRQTNEHRPVALAPVLNQEIEELRSEHDNATIRVEGTIPEVEVSANSLLESVFRNLLTNAIQHNDKPVPELTVSVAEDSESVTIRIADNGPGVPDGQKDAIFGRGEKGLDSPGSGIGLYLVETLVESYDGEVWVEDHDPEGAVFVVKLPRVL
ncbi:two-component system sensor histidine kinase NtrB [Halorientalis marina]|uniref:two-component system sensor histidine kinase NtrB n=1 Tax=Halorientalis marina TaxID=2931976 RepID=UPI001FF2E3FE|nr:PAS domain-containing sensor histidine kinase [Halorientalis marina]